VKSHTECCDGDLEVSNKSWNQLQTACNKCQDFCVLDKHTDDHELKLNEALVIGAYSAGTGYSGLFSIFTMIECPFVSEPTYRRAEVTIGNRLQIKMKEDLAKNLQDTKEFAFQNSHVVEVNSIQHPTATVSVDGGWAKRAYGHSYSSNAGVAVIISEALNKILYVGFRVKSCIFCTRKSNKDHKCFRNWEQSSQAMEADIIAQGFQECYEDSGLIFKHMVGDADSSVHSKVQATVMYPGRIPVEKIDCANHGVKGLNTRIFGILKNTSYCKKDRDLIQKHRDRFGKDVRAAIAYNHQNSKTPVGTTAITLAEDISNIPCHIFGSHKRCKPYFCQQGGDYVYDYISSTPAGKDLIKGFQLLANRAYKLLPDATSNHAESFMAIMNKTISGKRVNYAQRGGYANRCAVAALTYNHGKFWPAHLLVKDLVKGPCRVWKEASLSYQKKRLANKRSKKPKSFRTKKAKQSGEEFYGVNATQGTLTDDERLIPIKQLIEDLQVTPDERDQIQLNTVGQNFCEEWKFQRRNRITASNCGKIYR